MKAISVVDMYNRGLVTEMTAASTLLGTLAPQELSEVLGALPPPLFVALKQIVDAYPLDDEDSLVVISNEIIGDEDLAHHRACARRNVPLLRKLFKGEPPLDDSPDGGGRCAGR